MNAALAITGRALISFVQVREAEWKENSGWNIKKNKVANKKENWAKWTLKRKRVVEMIEDRSNEFEIEEILFVFGESGRIEISVRSIGYVASVKKDKLASLKNIF